MEVRGGKMELIDLIIDFHQDAKRLGPGSDEETERALSFVGELSDDANILDLGCGTGAQTMVLAEKTPARIVAVDLFPQFLAKLEEKIQARNLETRVKTEKGSMLELPYPDREFNVIWAEGSIYNMGFTKGLQEWKRLLKPGGYMAVSEISWLTATRPTEVEEYWTKNYAEIDTISNKIKVIEDSGYLPVAHFVLPEDCWVENYYRPILERSEAFLQKYNYHKKVRAFIEAGQGEADLYARFKDYYSYVFYIIRKV